LAPRNGPVQAGGDCWHPVVVCRHLGDFLAAGIGRAHSNYSDVPHIRCTNRLLKLLGHGERGSCPICCSAVASSDPRKSRLASARPGSGIRWRRSPGRPQLQSIHVGHSHHVITEVCDLSSTLESANDVECRKAFQVSSSCGIGHIPILEATDLERTRELSRL